MLEQQLGMAEVKLDAALSFLAADELGLLELRPVDRRSVLGLAERALQHLRQAVIG